MALFLLCTEAHAASGRKETTPQLQQAIRELRQQQAALRTQRDELDAELAKADRGIASLALRLRRLGARRHELEQRLQELKLRQQEQAQQVAKLRRELAALVRSAYLAGREARLKLLLNQQDPARMSRMLAYHDYLARSRMQKLQQLRQQLDQLARLAEQVAQEREALQRTTRRLTEQREELQQQKAQRTELLAKLEARLRQGDRRLRQMQENARHLTAVVRESARALRALKAPRQKPFAKRRGRLPWPLAGRLAVSFGSEKIGNLRWDGVIIRAPEGREVKAVHSGRVAYADWLRGYGLLIIVDHGDGYMTLYGHNQSLLKQLGDWVEEGEVIGLAGRSGGLRHPGIYFGIRHDGKPVNPARWCRRTSGRKVG